MWFSQDSFFTLSIPAQLGLAALSLALALGTLWLTRRIATGRAWPLRLILALTALALFVWLSPQAYYTYYIAIFDSLPWQSVVKAPPDPAHLLRLLTGTAEHSLSRYGQGVLGWALIVNTLR